MTPRKKYLLTPKLSKTYEPAWLPSLGQKYLKIILKCKKTYKAAYLATDFCNTQNFNLLTKVSTRFYLGLYNSEFKQSQ